MQPKIVVAGGGFAGLEALFYLRYKLGNEANLTLVSDQDYFLFKPNTIYIPFGEDPEKFRIPLARPVLKKRITFYPGRAVGVDPIQRKLVLERGEIDYDYLVLATGASMRPEEVPGLSEYACTLWTPEEMLRLRHQLAQVVERAGEGRKQDVVFVVPPNNKCSGPLYELVMMIDTWLRRHKVRDSVQITWATYESSFIQAFGPRLHTVVSEEFAERGVEGHTGWMVSQVTPERVIFQDGSSLPFDLLVSFPPYAARQAFAGLPSDPRGFIKVDPDSRRVKGMESIFAVGDAADFPIKQAFLALLQGDAAAECIAAEIQKRPCEEKMKFEPMSMCVMEEMNKATFAQVPLRYTDDPEHPVTVDVDDVDHYKVGVSPLWRGGKKVLGLYLPWRFSNGDPFHAGFAWELMDMGLKVMSKVLAN
jgi:NADH dehydrogenase FAD-containing subunit